MQVVGVLATDGAGRIRPSCRKIVAESKYTRSHTMRSPSKRKRATVGGKSNSRPVGGMPRIGPRCVPMRSNSTITPASVWCSARTVFRWSGNAVRDAVK